MNLEAIFMGCFVFGLAFTAIAFVGGVGHLHLGHWHMGHASAHTRGSRVGIFNGFSLAAFLCWFGGIGYLLMRAHSFTALIATAIATLSGLAAAALLSGFLTQVLMRHERQLLPEDTEMRGVLARISNTVRECGTGEIVFTLNGTRRGAAARSTDNQPLARGTEVVVTDYHRGVAWVTPYRDAGHESSTD